MLAIDEGKYLQVTNKYPSGFRCKPALRDVHRRSRSTRSIHRLWTDLLEELGPVVRVGIVVPQRAHVLSELILICVHVCRCGFRG